YKDMHPLLRLPDAQTFILILKMGSSMYSSTRPITDPLFADRNPAPPDWAPFYLPDTEATGIACVEQTQVCMELPTGLKCYRWTKRVGDIPQEFLADTRHFYGEDGLAEYFLTFWRNFDDVVHDLQHFLRRYIALQNPPLLARPTPIDP